MTPKSSKSAAPVSNDKRALPVSSWDHRIITVALSERRRKALQKFAHSIAPELSKAEALYELIDRALPFGVGPTPNPEAEEARAIASRSAQALETVAAALAPLLSADGLSDVAAPGRAGALPDFEPSTLAAGATSGSVAPSPAGRLPPKLWLDGALKRLGANASHVELVMMCASAHLAAPKPMLVFQVERIVIDGRSRYRGNAALPMIAVPLRLGPSDPDIGVRTLMAGASLLASPSNGGWDCHLAQPANPAAPPLLRFKC